MRSSRRLTPAPAIRDPALDVVRGVALVRVVLWHTFGAAWLTWVVAAIPAMFFVTGSLLASSFGRRPPLHVVRARLRRLLLPFWSYAALAVTVVAVVGYTTSRDGWSGRDLAPWLLPVTDPALPDWADGWGSSHLWYLRAFLWLLVLSPLLWWTWRRVGVALPLLLLALLTGGELLDGTSGTRSVWQWRLGDLMLYGLFLVGGFAHHDGRFRSVSAPARAAAGVACAGATAALIVVGGGPPGWVVNDSHVFHLLVRRTRDLAALDRRRASGAGGHVAQRPQPDDLPLAPRGDHRCVRVARDVRTRRERPGRCRRGRRPRRRRHRGGSGRVRPR